MSKYVIDSATITGIADAIRTRTGTTDSIVVSDMPAKIEEIGEPLWSTPAEYIASHRPKSWPVPSIAAGETAVCITAYGDPALLDDERVVSLTVGGTFSATVDGVAADVSGGVSFQMPGDGQYHMIRLSGEITSCAFVGRYNPVVELYDSLPFLVGSANQYTIVYITQTAASVSLGTTMGAMFNNCASLEAVDVSGWDTGSVTSMYAMFNNCVSLEALDVSGWDTGSVTGMYAMFQNCLSLEALDYPAYTEALKSKYAYPNAFARLLEFSAPSIAASISFSASPRLRHDSLVGIIAALTQTTGQTLTLGSANLAKLTAAEIAVGTAKGWVIA